MTFAIFDQAVFDQTVFDAVNDWDTPVRKILGKVEIQYTDSLRDSGITITSSGVGNGTFNLQAFDNQEEPSHKYLEVDHGLTDGTFYTAPDTIKQGSIGWWSDAESDSSGNFSPAVWIQGVFTPRPFTDLKLVGDSLLNEYAVDFTIKLYQADDVLVHTETVTGNTLVEWIEGIATFEDIVKVKAEITKWSKANACAKVLELFSVYVETYEGDDLLKITLLEEREYQGATIPLGNISANEISVRFNNADRHFDPDNPASPIRDLIVKNRLIKPYLGIDVLGTVTWVALGKFWSVEWDVPSEDIYSEVRGLDKLEFLRTTEYSISTVLQNQSLAYLALLVFQDSGLADNEYYIDPALDDINVPYAWFDPMGHRDALKKIAEAGLAVLYSDRGGIIRLEIPVNQVSSAFTFNRSNFFTRDQPLAWNELANYVVVEATPYTPDTEVEVYSASEDVVVPAGEQVTIECIFSKSPCVDVGSPTLSGATNTHVESSTVYSWCATVVLHNNGAASETITGLVIRGKPLVNNGSIRAIAQDASSILINGKSALATISNEFIQTSARAQEIANALLAVYKDPRKDIVLEARGVPTLELGDRITAPLFGLTNADYCIIRQNIEWDGGLDVTITGQRIKEEES